MAEVVALKEHQIFNGMEGIIISFDGIQQLLILMVWLIDHLNSFPFVDNLFQLICFWLTYGCPLYGMRENFPVPAFFLWNRTDSYKIHVWFLWNSCVPNRPLCSWHFIYNIYFLVDLAITCDRDTYIILFSWAYFYEHNLIVFWCLPSSNKLVKLPFCILLVCDCRSLIGIK